MLACLMGLVDHASLPPARLDELARAVGPLAGLEAVVRWALALSPPSTIAEVVIQDEYTHDVVVALADGLHLVFDTT
jgi:hypothetical protein